MAANPIKVRFDDENLTYLEEQSLKSGKPVTAIINQKICESRRSIPAESFLGAVDHPQVFRLKSSSTTAEVKRICDLVRSGMLENIVLGVNECAHNERTLSGYVELASCIVLLDGVSINHAREPRIMEVEDLLKTVASSQHSFAVGLIEEIIKPTRQLAPEEAWDYFKSLSTSTFSIASFLNVIAPSQQHNNLLPYMPNDGYCVTIAKPIYYGRDELVHLKVFEFEVDAIEHLESITRSGSPDGEGKEFVVTMNIYGRPHKWEKVVEPKYPKQH